MRHQRAKLSKEAYRALRKFKEDVREERIGKFVKDHRGHFYKVDENGSFRRASRDDLIIAGLEDS